MSNAVPSGRHALVPHPASQSGPVRSLTVDVERPSPAELTLEFHLEGEIAALRIPEPRVPVRADGLWRHTCFELFIGQSDGPGYWEYNFSPSGAWAAYHFTGYREGMATLTKGAPPNMTLAVSTDLLIAKVHIDTFWLLRAASSPLRLAVAAVIESQARVLAYWALKHPAEKPDFHHAEGFVLPLD
jgi:hypothetical protein